MKMEKIKNYKPPCFRTKQYSKGSGICKRCCKYEDCKINDEDED